MTRIAKNITPEDVEDGIALGQQLLSGGVQDFNLNGSLVVDGVFTVIDSGHLIDIKSLGNDAGITFTITGTDSRDVPISETISGGNIATVSSTKYFKTVTQVSSSGDTDTADVSIGVAGLCVSPWIQMNQGDNIDIGLFVVLNNQNMTWQIEHTPDDIQQNADVTFNTFPHDDLTAKTTSEDGNYAFPATAYRMKVTVFTSGTATFTSWQAF